jgi:hypothetical protein
MPFDSHPADYHSITDSIKNNLTFCGESIGNSVGEIIDDLEENNKQNNIMSKAINIKHFNNPFRESL